MLTTTNIAAGLVASSHTAQYPTSKRAPGDVKVLTHKPRDDKGARLAKRSQRASITAIDRLCKGQGQAQPHMAQRQAACSTEVANEAVQGGQDQAKDGRRPVDDAAIRATGVSLLAWRQCHPKGITNSRKKRHTSQPALGRPRLARLPTRHKTMPSNLCRSCARPVLSSARIRRSSL